MDIEKFMEGALLAKKGEKLEAPAAFMELMEMDSAGVAKFASIPPQIVSHYDFVWAMLGWMCQEKFGVKESKDSKDVNKDNTTPGKANGK